MTTPAIRSVADVPTIERDRAEADHSDGLRTLPKPNAGTARSGGTPLHRSGPPPRPRPAPPTGGRSRRHSGRAMNATRSFGRERRFCGTAAPRRLCIRSAAPSGSGEAGRHPVATAGRQFRPMPAVPDGEREKRLNTQTDGCSVVHSPLFASYPDEAAEPTELPNVAGSTICRYR